MIFSVQRAAEDYLNGRGFQDNDDYAINVSRTYESYRASESDGELLARLRRIRTAIYQNHPGVNRAAEEKRILQILDQRSRPSAPAPHFLEQRETRTERIRLRKLKRRAISSILQSFRRAVQGRTIDAFWKSRKKTQLRPWPETIAQAHLSLFILGGLSRRPGYLCRELLSGIGFVDLAVFLGGSTPHLIELKVLTNKFTGPSQLETYMDTENRSTGWLIVFDARIPKKKTQLPPRLTLKNKTINVISVDINPEPPSSKV
jgi:hypothetical protein